jgi:anti-sigma B factor antagonist
MTEMSCDYGQGTGLPDAQRRPLGGVRCRPTAVAERAPAPEVEWRYDIVQVLDRLVVTEVAGEIDLRTGAILRKRLFELTDAGFGSIIIDFDGVRFCDAAGLGVLVAAQNRLRELGGSISLVGVRAQQRRLLQVAGLDRVFTLYDSVPQALRAHENPTTAPAG